MAIVPKSFNERILFFECRASAIEEHAAALGLSPEEAASFRAQVDIAREAYQRQCDAQRAARSAMIGMSEAVKTLNTAGISIVKRVRAHAGIENDPLLLNLIGIAPIRKKSPIGKPGTPFDLKTQLDGIGNLKLTWKCKHPRGAQQTVYRVWRRIGFNGPKELVAYVGTKKFVDETIPAGVTQLLYEIQAVRSTCEGQVANFNVYFGSNRETTTSPIAAALRNRNAA